MKKGKALSHVFTALVMLFLFAPILVLIVFSFNESKSRALFTGFTFKWYVELFRNETIMSALWGSVSMAVCASTVAAVVGTAAAVGIYKLRGKRVKSLIMNVTYLPILNPEIVTGISMMLLFVYIKNLTGLRLGFETVLIAHVTFCLPYASFPSSARWIRAFMRRRRISAVRRSRPSSRSFCRRSCRASFPVT